MKIFIPLFIVFFTSQAALADVLIEPYGGMQSGKTEGLIAGHTGPWIASNGPFETDYDGTIFGARIGYTSSFFSFGVDTSFSQLTYDDDDELDVNTVGVFAGVELPILLRFYAGYLFLIDSDDGATTKDPQGTGFKLGISFTSIPFVYINAEAIVTNYDDINNDNSTNAGSFDVIDTTDFKDASFVVSLSFPIVF